MTRVKFLAAIFGLVLTVVRVQAAHVVFNWTDFTAHPESVRSYALYPIGAPFTNGGGVIIARDRVVVATGTNGSVTVSNVYGGDYRGELAGTWTTTTNWFHFPTSSGLINASDWVTIPTNYQSIVAYSASVADGRFLTNALINAPALIGAYRITNGPVITLGPSNTFDAGGLRDPCLVTNAGKYYYYYSASRTNSGNLVTIGMAVSSDGSNWVKVGQVLSTNMTGGLWDSGLVFSPGVYIENGRWYMFYSGTTNTGQAWIDGPFQCGLATSTDGTNWTRYAGNPLLTAETVSSSVSKQGSTYVMLFNTHGPQAIGRATAASLTGPWTKNASSLLVSPPGFGFGLEAPIVLKVWDGLWLVFCDNANSTFPFGQAHYGQEMFYMTNLVSGSMYYAGRINGKLPSASSWDWYGMGVSGYAFRPDGKILQMYNAWGTNITAPLADPRGRQIGASVLTLDYEPVVPLNRQGFVPTAQGWYRVLRSERYAAGRMRFEARNASEDHTTTGEFSFHISDDGTSDMVQHEYRVKGNAAITKARTGAFSVSASGRSEVYLDLYVGESDPDILGDTSILMWLDGPLIITNETPALNPTAGDKTPPDLVFFTGAKGDLLVHNGTNWWNNFARGSDGQVLSADSTTALGLKWIASSADGFGPWKTNGNDIYFIKTEAFPSVRDKVGIGTNAPAAALHIDTADATGLPGSILLTTTDADTQVGVQMRNTATANNWQWYLSGDAFRLGKQSVADFVTLDSTGNLQENGNARVTGRITNDVLTASRLVVSDTLKALASAAASGAVPIDADGSAATFAQVNALAKGTVLTNGNDFAVTVSNQFRVDIQHAFVASNATASRVAMFDAANQLTNVFASTAPINGDGTRTTFAQLNLLAPGDILTNGESLAVTVSNQFRVDVTHAFVASNATASRVLMTDAANQITNVATSTAPINGDGSATTFAQINALAAGTITTNGSWTRTTIVGGASTFLDNTANQWAPLSGIISASSSQTNRCEMAPYGGYLSNFVFCFGKKIAATTNVVAAIQTSTVGSVVANPTDTALLVTLKGETGIVFTNTSTEVYTLPSSRDTLITVRMITSTGQGTASGAYWSVEWWHQIP